MVRNTKPGVEMADDISQKSAAGVREDASVETEGAVVAEEDNGN
jgi:hypothetical protein